MPKVGDKKALVIRDNRLVRSSYWLTPPEKRFVYWLFWSFQQNKQREQTVSIAELAKFCEVEGGSVYRTMYEVAHRLQGRVVVIWDIEEDAPSFVNFTERITPNLGKGTIKVVIHSAVEPLLRDLQQNFTTTALETAVRLSSFYAMRLYDLALCHRFRNDGMLYGLTEIKAELGVLELVRKSKTEVEIRSDRWPEWKRFKEKVLDRALREVNEKTDVHLELIPVKSGREVTHVRLLSRANPQGKALSGLTERLGDMVGALVKAGMSAAEARRIVDAYGERDPERITWHLINCKKADKPLAWLRAGVKKDYRPQGSLFTRTSGPSDKSEREREKVLRSRPVPERPQELRPIGELLSKIEDPKLAAAFGQMQQGLAGRSKRNVEEQ